MGREEEILGHARETGFDLAGIAPLEPPPDAARFEAWLDAGRHGGMSYLEANRARIADPRGVLESGRSLLVVGLAHSRARVELPGGGRVARYAAGRDYHNVVGKMLRKLARVLEREGLLGKKRVGVDAVPLLERSHAEVAGLGFISKAANLLHPRFGPWFFLGELLLEDELTPTREDPGAGSCGTCTACIDACPTGAILEAGLVDARTGISYQTIENRGHVPRELREAQSEWVFGCDVCSEVCPFGAHAPDLAERFGIHPEVEGGSLIRWLDREGDFGGSPLQRPRPEGLARNAAIALSHHRSDRGREALLRALSFDPSPLVRETSAWALARAHGAEKGVREALGKALRREPDPAAAREMGDHL